MADAAQFERELFRVERFVEKHSAERDLSRADKAEIAVLDRIDLRLGAARIEADALEDFVLRQVGSCGEREVFLQKNIESVPLQGQIEQNGVVLQKIKAVAC